MNEDVGSYNDFLLDPVYSEVPSRSHVDLTSDLGRFKLALPVISANMKNVTGPAMCQEMAAAGGLGILHRFCTIEENVEMYERAQEISDWLVGVSVGVRDEEYKRVDALIEHGAKLICVDAAHGHHIKVMTMIRYIKSTYPGYTTIIAGNIATPEAASDLIKWGADIVKVGIGPGAACTTRKTTGVGVPQLYALQRIKEKYPDIKMIADGGIRNVCDISKALVYADAVMVGAILAGTIETPGKVYPNDDDDLVNRTYYKIYGGSASTETKGDSRFVEGKIIKVPFKGHVKYILREIVYGLQSALSLCGSSNLVEFKQKSKLIKLSYGSIEESRT
jgi:IMP dehydrogenase